jgi:type IV pilus assembly protein PilM
MSQKKATIVNLAASHVSVSLFGVQSKGLVLEKFYVEEIAPGLTNDDEWLNTAMGALGNLVTTYGISGQVTVIAPSFLLLQKALKVPQVERQRQAQIVAFEAQNAIPYPLNEVIWDSQVMASDGVEAEVLLFALRTEMASKIANLVAATGLRPLAVQAAPLLDSQAFLLAGGSATEEVLIINIGARSTTLSFIGPSGSNIQTANIGGNLLTQGVSDNTGQPFMNAEAIKVGYYSGVIHLPESDPQVAILQANAQSFIRRLTQDINRRLINVRRGTAGRQPTRILLTGRGSLVSGLSEQLCETLRMPVEPFDPSSVLALGADVDPENMQRARHQISEVIGEAARLVLKHVTGVNLIPRDIAAQLAFDARKPVLLVAALLMALIPWPIWWAFDKGADTNRELSAKLVKRKTELGGHQAAIEETRKKATEVFAINKKLEDVALSRPNWPAFLSDLQSRVSSCKNTWIEELEVKRVVPPAITPVEPPPPGTVVVPPARLEFRKEALLHPRTRVARGSA